MKRGGFLKNTLFFSLATLISRVLGYVRDATVAFIFGANPLTDAFFVAWRIPNTLRQLVAEGSFNAAFIPIFTDLEKKDPEYSKRFASSMFSFYTFLLSVITFLAVLFSDYIVSIIAPGLSQKGTLSEASKLLKIVFPYLVLVGWVSFFMALLNTRDRFFIPAVSPALLNLSFIFFAIFLSQDFGIYALAFGALMGGVLQVLIQLPLILKENLLPEISFQFLPEIKETLRRLAPAFASFGISQFGFIVDTIIASFLIGGAISYLYYANRIFQLPIGLFAIGLGNALLVSLSKHYSEKNKDLFNKDLNDGLRFAIFISIPAIIGMLVLGKEIIAVLLERGAFSPEDTIHTFYALAGYSIGLIGYAVSRPFKSAFFATGNMKIPLYSTITGVLISIVFAIIFGFILRWGVFGLAFASSLGGIAGFIYLYLISDFHIDKKQIIETFIKSFISGLLMGLSVLMVKFIFTNLFVQVFGGIAVAIAVYLGSSLLLKEKSAKKLISIIKTA